MKPLSFIIITYNRPADMLELLKNISSLKNAFALLEEIIVVNNSSTEDYTAVELYMQSGTELPFKYYIAPSNLGVAKGRNYALAKGKAPYIIMLDDDAELQNNDCLEKLLQIFEEDKNEKKIAIVSFKVLYFDTLQMQKNALPHKQFYEYKGKDYFETYYYAGGAHCIKRAVLDKVGNYPEDFFYGMEEYDLSYRILDNDYKIVYSSSVVMLHKESPLGRKPLEQKVRMMWVNKSIVAYKYLPKRYFYSTAFMWSLQYLKMSGFNLNGYLTGWKQVIKIYKTYKRSKVKSETVRYIKKLDARLWY